MSPVVTVTQTVMSGSVVRWYTSKATGDRGDTWLSASRDGVLVNGYLHEIPPDVLAIATATYRALARNRDADVTGLATHHRPGIQPTSLVRIDRTEGNDLPL